MQNVLVNTKIQQQQSHQVSKLPGEVVTQSAEVFDVILDDTHIDYIDETSIGIIKFKFISANNISLESSLNSARPLDPNDIKYPLKHEIVLIISAPAPAAGIQNDARCFYYMNPIGIWGLVNNNVLPYASTLPTSNIIKFGKYFIESPEFAKLEPQEGDKIISGRFGNYIRFTSVQTQSKKPWNAGVNNSPIIIISTDNVVKNKKVEDVNKDASSIYVIQNADIKFKSNFTNYKSYNSPPSPTYTGAQILLNSDRIQLNSKKDHLLLTSEQTVSIAGKSGVNIDSTSNIVFGNISNASGIPLGKETNNILNSILDIFLKLANPAGPVAAAAAADIAALKVSLQLNQNLSTQVYSS